MARRWHFFFAWLFVINGVVYAAYAPRRPPSARATCCRRAAISRHIGRSLRDHARLRFPKGEAAKRYNVLQKLAYLGVVFVLCR